MLDDVRAVEFYHDSTVEEPKEDPDRIRERLGPLADREGIEYEAVDTADMSDEERRNLHQETAAELRAGREYHVGNRVFAGGMFGSRRPVLVVRYDEGVDLYPHRNDDVKPGVIGVLDFLDEVDGTTETDDGERRADYALLRRQDRETPEEVAESKGSETEENDGSDERREEKETSPSNLLSKLGALLPG